MSSNASWNPAYTDAERALIERVETRMEEMMAKYDPSHDKYHVQRVRRTAMALAHSYDADSSKTTKPDLLVVELAALMHDMLDKKYVPAELAADPEAFFLPLLSPSESESSLDLSKDGRASLVAKIVDNVSWSTEKKRRASGEWGSWHDECVELHCVQDADRLDAIGAFGVMRVAAYGASRNRPLYVPRPIPEGQPEPDDTIEHFHYKLLLVKDRMKTDAGRRMAEKRHQFMLTFLEAVDDEYANKI